MILFQRYGEEFIHELYKKGTEDYADYAERFNESENFYREQRQHARLIRPIR